MSGDASSVSARRKDDHVRLAAAQQDARVRGNEFDDAEFVHHALGAIDEQAVSLETAVARWRWRAPLYINGMTGGGAESERVNRELAIAARENGIPMASGSVAIALDDERAARGFRVIREENPDGLVFANLGIGRTGDEARRAVDLLAADALQLHLNAVQETVMPEGTREFSSWRAALEEVVAASPVPVIVKEVGFGLSRSTLALLADLGVEVADVAGVGGTDFAAIEAARRDDGALGELAGFGQSALACLLDAPSHSPHLLASGGVRHPLDVVKALALGAEAIGAAGAFLRPALSGEAGAASRVVGEWLQQLHQLLALLGAPTPHALVRSDVLLRGRLREFCELRGIDVGAYARRSESIQGERTT
ncbi:MAG: type 2 isopentenyl-diphosphate Delta-isomerase [Microbacterium sp.]